MSLIAAARELALLYACTPNDRAREHLNRFCIELEANLLPAVGADIAARIADAFAQAVMAEKARIESGVAGAVVQ